MKNQALFSLKDKSKKLKCRLLQFLLGTLRVKKLQYAFLWFLSPSGLSMRLDLPKLPSKAHVPSFECVRCSLRNSLIF